MKKIKERNIRKDKEERNEEKYENNEVQKIIY